MGVKQRVIDGLAVPAVFDEAVLFEDAELVGNCALGHSQFFGDVVDAFFFVNQGVQDLQPGRSAANCSNSF